MVGIADYCRSHRHLTLYRGNAGRKLRAVGMNGEGAKAEPKQLNGLPELKELNEEAELADWEQLGT
jgi:hypothetical protein